MSKRSKRRKRKAKETTSIPRILSGATAQVMDRIRHFVDSGALFSLPQGFQARPLIPHNQYPPPNEYTIMGDEDDDGPLMVQCPYTPKTSATAADLIRMIEEGRNHYVYYMPFQTQEPPRRLTIVPSVPVSFIKGVEKAAGVMQEVMHRAGQRLQEQVQTTLPLFADSALPLVHRPADLAIIDDPEYNDQRDPITKQGDTETADANHQKD